MDSKYLASVVAKTAAAGVVGAGFAGLGVAIAATPAGACTVVNTYMNPNTSTRKTTGGCVSSRYNVGGWPSSHADTFTGWYVSSKGAWTDGGQSWAPAGSWAHFVLTNMKKGTSVHLQVSSPVHGTWSF